MTYLVEASATIPAPSARIYEILADFREHHDRITHGQITPPKYFGPLNIEQGGVGAGTVIRFQMTVLGRTVDCRSVVAC